MLVDENGEEYMPRKRNRGSPAGRVDATPSNSFYSNLSSPHFLSMGDRSIVDRSCFFTPRDFPRMFRFEVWPPIFALIWWFYGEGKEIIVTIMYEIKGVVGTITHTQYFLRMVQ